MNGTSKVLYVLGLRLVLYIAGGGGSVGLGRGSKQMLFSKVISLGTATIGKPLSGATIIIPAAKGS
jgi:hypothetical protein